MKATVRIAIVVGLLFLTSVSASAEIPHLIRYQGQAVDRQGVPLEGPYTLHFRLYDAETGGTVVWEEVQEPVELTEGHFSVLLGQVSALDGMEWTEPCWLSVQVNGEPELAPRQRITSVPLALHAGVAERLSVPVTTSTIADDAHGLVPTGAIILWNGAGCPAGYTRLSAYDGKFLVGSSTSGTTGGSNTHTHGAGSYVSAAHTHTIPAGNTYAAVISGGTDGDNRLSLKTGNIGMYEINRKYINSDIVTNSGGATDVSGTSSAADSRPEFMTILLCKKE